MAQWSYCAKYDSINKLWSSSEGWSENPVVNNVSEVITANNESEAREVAKVISERYRQRGDVLRDEVLLECKPVAPKIPTTDVSNFEVLDVVSRSEAPRKLLKCSCCGAFGYRGDYPFSTLPDSGRCDDCV